MNVAIGELRFLTTEDAASKMLRANGLKSYSNRPLNRFSRQSPNNHPHLNPPRSPSHAKALRPRGFSHRLRDEKSLVYFVVDR